MKFPGAALLGLETLPDDDLPPSVSGPVRRPRPRSPWWRRALWGLTAAAVLAGVTWVVAFSPVLGVREVEVRGEALLSETQIRDAAGIAPGTPLVRLGAGGIEARIEALPEVLSARVRVSYPSTVLIEVTERVAVGYRTESSGIRLIDVTGAAFRTVDERPAGLPQLPAPPRSGSWSDADEAAALACAQVAAALPGQVRPQVAQVKAESANSVRLTLTDDRTVVWGGAVRNKEKAALLVPLLGREGAEFDISTEGIVVVR